MIYKYNPSSSEEDFQFDLTDEMDTKMKTVADERKAKRLAMTDLDKITEHGSKYRNVGFCRIASKYTVGRASSKKILCAEQVNALEEPDWEGDGGRPTSRDNKLFKTVPGLDFNGQDEKDFRTTVPTPSGFRNKTNDTDRLTDKESQFRNTTYEGWTDKKTGRNIGHLTFFKTEKNRKPMVVGGKEELWKTGSLKMPYIDMEKVYPQVEKDEYQVKFKRIQQEQQKQSATYDGVKIIKQYVKPNKFFLENDLKCEKSNNGRDSYAAKYNKHKLKKLRSPEKAVNLEKSYLPSEEQNEFLSNIDAKASTFYKTIQARSDNRGRGVGNNEKGQIQINQRFLFGTKGDILFGDSITAMSHNKKIGLTEASQKHNSNMGVYKPPQFFEKNFTRGDYIKTAKKYGRGVIPVRKNMCLHRPAVRDSKKRPYMPPRFGTIGGGAITETEIINEPGYNQQRANDSPVKLGGGQIVMLESQNSKATQSPVAKGAGLKSDIQCEANKVPEKQDSVGKASKALPSEGKLQFKAPFVENLFASKQASINSRQDELRSNSGEDSKLTSPKSIRDRSKIGSRGYDEILSQNASIRVEDNDALQKTPMSVELASNHFMSSEHSKEGSMKKKLRLWKKGDPIPGQTQHLLRYQNNPMSQGSGRPSQTEGELLSGNFGGSVPQSAGAGQFDHELTTNEQIQAAIVSHRNQIFSQDGADHLKRSIVEEQSLQSHTSRSPRGEAPNSTEGSLPVQMLKQSKIVMPSSKGQRTPDSQDTSRDKTHGASISKQYALNVDNGTAWKFEKEKLAAVNLNQTSGPAGFAGVDFSQFMKQRDARVSVASHASQHSPMYFTAGRHMSTASRGAAAHSRIVSSPKTSTISPNRKNETRSSFYSQTKGVSNDFKITSNQ